MPPKFCAMQCTSSVVTFTIQYHCNSDYIYDNSKGLTDCHYEVNQQQMTLVFMISNIVIVLKQTLSLFTIYCNLSVSYFRRYTIIITLAKNNPIKSQNNLQSIVCQASY